MWLWKEWPNNDGADTGIDLVAEESNGDLCAIQCKCYDENGSLSLGAVSTFIAKSASLDIRNTILVYTGEGMTGHARKVILDNKTQIINSSNFRDSSIIWDDYPHISAREPKKLYQHQAAACKAVLDGLGKHDRGKLIMACGTGKTLTSLHIAEKYAGTGRLVLYLVPSISLILQTMREWSENSNIHHNYIAVCSDRSTGEDGSIIELESPVSTDESALKRSCLLYTSDAADE